MATAEEIDLAGDVLVTAVQECRRSLLNTFVENQYDKQRPKLAP